MSWVLALALLHQAAASSGSVCVDAPLNLLCLNWTTDSTNITFSGFCSPPPGMTTITWCAFGLSTASVGDMFPSVVTAIQAGSASTWLEDRDSFIGYRSPPCFGTQVSTLLSSSKSGGNLTATWTRPLNVSAALAAQHYQNLGGKMTLIAASSSDTPAEASVCEQEMQLHTYCVPGTPVVI